MTVSISTPVTGGAQTGFTTPSITLTTDVAPSINGKQYAATAVSGMPNVDSHSVSKPFTITVMRPSSMKVLPAPSPVTGIIKQVPKNTYKIIVRKGAVPYANQQAQIAMINCSIDVPAGTDTYEPEEIRAMLSLFIGAVQQISAGLGDTATTGIL